MKDKNKPVAWSLSQIWNEAAIKEDKPLVKRDYVYASEVGMPFYDRYLKMNAIKYTNPPNSRSLRKFLAGNIWEHTTKQILVACGVYRHEEIKIDAQPYKDTLSVHGRCDFIAGGYIDTDISMKRLNELVLPDYLHVVGKKIIEVLGGATLQEIILELKSCSTFAMDKVERSKMAMPNHQMQAYHYQKNGKMQASIAYICKDDCRMAQFDVNEKIAEPLYRADLEQITKYFKKKKQPPKDPLAIFDEVLGKFSKNLGVEYSPYLSHYGFKTPEEFRDAVKFVDKWNRTLNRFVLAETGCKTPTGKPITITPKNKEIEKEIEKAGYHFASLLECKIRIGAEAEDTDD